MTVLFVSLAEIADWWDVVFFTPQPTLTYAVFRILLGILLVTDTVQWFIDYPMLLAPRGWYGHADYMQHDGRTRFSLLTYLPSGNRSVVLVLGVQGVAAVGLGLGIFPQLAAAICFLTLVSIHNRNQYALSSGDTVLRFFCLFMVFAPSGMQLVVGDFFRLHPEAHGCPWPLVMTRLFMANIYLKNVLFKLQGASWRDGTATQKLFGVPIWLAMRLPNVLNHKWFYRLSTYGTIGIETALFSLIWIEEFRIPMVVAGITFHLCLALFLRVRLFQGAMIAGLLCFITPQEYERLAHWLFL